MIGDFFLSVIDFINGRILGVLTPVVLILAGIFYMFRLKFFHITRLSVLTRSILGIERKKNSGDGKNKAQTENTENKGISPIRALLLALAGTLGVGNIVGVAGAVTFGGFGAIFWMWVSALAAMLLKYAEIVLAHGHRGHDASGNPHGSAMLYISDFFKSIHMRRLGVIISSIFAVMCIINSVTMGCIVQVNAISHALSGIFSVSHIVCGIFICLTCGMVLVRKNHAVSKVTEYLVPAMTCIYIILSVAVMLIRAESCGAAFTSIFKAAFSAKSTAGGVLGFITSQSLRFGTMRGLLSNEAGCGTAPIAHAESNGASAPAQGLLGIAEVFIDTLLLCTMTAIVLIISYDNVCELASDPVMMTIRAYSVVLGEWSGYVLGISVFLFGYATVICWAHYGRECVRYFSCRRIFVFIFDIIYCLSIVIGAVVAPDAVLGLADLALGTMTLINVPVLCAMSGEVYQKTVSFIADTRMIKTSRAEKSKYLADN